MRNWKDNLKKRKIDPSKLLNYGFKEKRDCYFYFKKFKGLDFAIEVTYSEDELLSKVIDTDINDEYLLVDFPNSSGEFVSTIRTEYEKIVLDIINNCSEDINIEKKLIQQVKDYVLKKYGDELGYLWKKDDSAIWRNKENLKWYGALIKVKENRIRGNSEEVIEIIDLCYQKNKINEIIDNVYIFPGYHMNKNSWITIVLDGSVSYEKICELIDNSYEIAKCKK